MKKVIATGKTIEDAIQVALSKLGVTREQVEIIVLTQPSRGLFGLIGARDAEIEAIVRDSMMIEEILEDIREEQAADVAAHPGTDDELLADPADAIEISRHFLQDVIHSMRISAEVTIEEEEEGQYLFQLEGERLGILIGRRGQTLDALQYLVNLVANKHSNQFLRIVLDAEGYRARRKESLERLADKLARQVIRERKPVELEAMPAHERKVIHTYLQGHAKVGTKSEGTEPNRKVIIYHKK